MIEKVIEYINELIENELGYYKKSYSLCELISKDGKFFPAYYCKNEFESVYKLDRHKNTVYHRINGNISISEVEEEETSTCDDYIRQSYPIRLISIVDKKTFGPKQNDGLFDAKISDNLVYLLSSKTVKRVAKQVGLNNVTIEVTSSNIDRDNNWSTEFRGNEMKLDYNYSIISISYNVILEGSKSCFKAYGC